MSTDLTTVKRAERGEYRKSVSPRVERALQALADGSCRTISGAAEVAQLTRRALTMALRKDHIKARMRELIDENLKAGSLRASSRMRELMEEAENSMVAYRASAYLLATGGGVVPPSAPLTQVNIGIAAERAGFVIDLSEGESAQRRLVVSPANPRVIEGEAREVPDEEPIDHK